ncbi:LysR family transcriptional regulator [Peribacillus saganii]|uniref:LysR family transcriptional regulator n=1 Tax=Peribacillus saganii TaxID=2303992 RepID=A0A372LRV8_9BACI|nr:LysR family transcriptional regulator [Peribacillus saganii]RFU70532.1 LysR family transcriptional regulator [Peribacillus saganii]
MFFINLLYLETFLIVCNNGNFTEAAKRLFVPQPTISNRIRYLEEELGQELFVRGKKGKRSVELTRAGKMFLPYAEQVIATINAAKSELNQDANENLMTIGSSIALTHPFIYEKINLLNEVHNKNINLLIMDHSLIAKSLIDGVLDLAFVTEPIINKHLESHPVFNEKYGLIVAEKHPLSKKKCLESVDELEEEFLIFYKALSKDQTTLRNIKCKKRIMTNQIELVNDLIHNHNGVSFLPSKAFENQIKKGKLVHVPIHDDLLICEIQYFVAYRKYEVFYEDIFLSEPTSVNY